MGDFGSYISALWQNWVWIMTGGPFLAERIARQIWPNYDPWIARYISAATRTRVTVAIAIFGFLAANFLAFSAEHEKVEQLSGRREVHRHVTASEAAAIKEHFAGAGSLIPLIRICSVSGPEPERYAADLQDAFVASGINAVVFMPNCLTISDEDRGLFIGLRDADHPSGAATEFTKRLLASGFKIKQTQLNPRGVPIPENFDFDLFVALPDVGDSQ